MKAAPLINLAAAISDGEPVNWKAAESRIELSRLPAVRQLRIVERIASLHASLPPSRVFGRSLHDSLAQPIDAIPADHPKRWGPLTIVQRIGGGTHADVYLARDTRLDRPVALKLLRHRETAAALESESIEEARLLARVHHQNVVAVFGAERIDDRAGIWMEFVDGRTLEQELAERGPFPVRELIATGAVLCRALAAVHAVGLLHRDVKAQNVMRARDGRLVLTDFGLGREVSEVLKPELAGTPLYLAPEILRGQPASIATDTYSLGVLLHHLATGSFPVAGRSLRDLRDAHQRGARIRVSASRPDVPDRLRAVIERATDSDPAARFRSPQQLEAALAPP